MPQHIDRPVHQLRQPDDIFLIFVLLLYVPCVSVMGAIARETSRGWMTFSILWGLNVAYSLATLFYQIATFSTHPQTSLITIAVVVIFNLILFILLRKSRNRLTINLGKHSSPAKQCCSKEGHCH